MKIIVYSLSTLIKLLRQFSSKRYFVPKREKESLTWFIIPTVKIYYMLLFLLVLFRALNFLPKSFDGINSISFAFSSSKINLVKRNDGSLIYATILPTPDSSGKPLNGVKSLKRIAGNRFKTAWETHTAWEWKFRRRHSRSIRLKDILNRINSI